MVIEYLKVLAQACKTYFEEMTKTPVVSVTVKREQRLRESYSVAFTCDFQAQNSPLMKAGHQPLLGCLKWLSNISRFSPRPARPISRR